MEVTARTTTRPSVNFIARDGGEYETKTFSIAVTKEACSILSDGLYSRKVEAVIRELSTNANDAHILFGIADSFEIHIPSYNSPWLTVVDYGEGMSHDKVMNLYSTYFWSDKTDDGKSTGALGLGSKSPLCKQRSFSVISRYKGIERHYIVALNEDRMPEVNHLVEQQCATTKQGIEIKVAVKIGDICEYQRVARKVFYYFDESRIPRITNYSDYTPIKKKSLLEGKGWKMVEGTKQSVAIQGNVGYPIAPDSVKGLKSSHMAVLRCGLEIKFPIDSLKFTPSRENLAYDTITCNTILDRLEEIVEEVNSAVSERFTKCKTMWEARTLAWTMFWNQDAELSHLSELASSGEILWQGEKIAGQQLNFSKIDGVEGWSFAFVDKNRGRYGRRVTSKVVKKKRSDYRPTSGVVWAEIDIPRGSISRCHLYVQQNPQKTVYLVQFSSKEAKKEFCEKMGLAGDEFIKTSTLPKPDFIRSTGGGGGCGRTTSMVFTLGDTQYLRRLRDYWTEASVDLDSEEGGVYLLMKNNKVVDEQGNRISPDEAIELLDYLKATGQEVPTVIGVRPQVAKKFGKADDWVDLWTYVRQVVKIEIVQNGLAEHIINAESYKGLSRLDIWKTLIPYEANLLDKLDSDGSLCRLVSALAIMAEERVVCKSWMSWKKLASFCSVEIKGTPAIDLQDCVQALYDAMPLVQSFVETKANNYYDKAFTDSQVESIIHYAVLLEKKKQTGG